MLCSVLRFSWRRAKHLNWICPSTRCVACPCTLFFHSLASLGLVCTSYTASCDMAQISFHLFIYYFGMPFVLTRTPNHTLTHASACVACITRTKNHKHTTVKLPTADLVILMHVSPLVCFLKKLHTLNSRCYESLSLSFDRFL